MAHLVRVGGDRQERETGDVVFLHGLGGDLRNTWTNKAGGFWPQWLADDNPQLNVWSVGYEAAASGWKGTAMPLFDRAHHVLAELQAGGLGHRPICFVTHSLGGLLIKQMLRNADSLASEFRPFSEATRGIVFLGTPHTGSDIASLVRYLNRLLRLTNATKELVALAPALLELNTWYRENVRRLGIETQAYFENKRTWGLFIVVDRGSADPSLEGVTPIGLDANHLRICKPTSKKAMLYKRSQMFIRNLLTEGTAGILAKAIEQQRRGTRHLLPAGMPVSFASTIRVGDLLDTDNLVVPQCYELVTRSESTSNTTSLRSEAVDALDQAMVILSAGHRVVILGEPGMGKTLLLQRLLDCLTEQFLLHPATAPVPVLTRLDTAIESPNTDLSVDGVVEACLGIPLETARQLRHSGRLLLLIDGCDEMPDPVGHTLARQLLNAATVVATRQAFYELRLKGTAPFSVFDLHLRLKELPFDEHVSAFVRTYCERTGSQRASVLLDILRARDDLRDLVARPLLLLMTVDVLDDLHAVTGYQSSTSSGRPRSAAALVYRTYADKWLGVEAARSPRMLDREDKQRLVRIAARTIFLRQGMFGSAATRQVTDLHASREQLVRALSGAADSGEIGDLASRLSLGDLLDELCYRTFLIRESRLQESFRFVHKSFVEFFVAFDLWLLLQEAARDDTPDAEGVVQAASAVMARPLPDEVVGFLRELLERSLTHRVEQEALCTGLRRTFEQAAQSSSSQELTVRQHAGNLLTYVATPSTVRYLEQVLETETEPFVRRGIIVGLAMSQGQTARLDRYVTDLDFDREAAQVQVGYTRVYHGDQVFNGEWRDDGEPECSNTIDQMLYRLQQGYHPMLWSLTLFTLRYLLQSGRGSEQLLRNTDERRFLVHFLQNTKPESLVGNAYDSQRRALLETLGVLGR
jgi:hypothetical protein